MAVACDCRENHNPHNPMLPKDDLRLDAEPFFERSRTQVTWRIVLLAHTQSNMQSQDCLTVLS